ncbi:MAG: immunoglobulin domain-containing protein [Verrucomicrobiia bacterium]
MSSSDPVKALSLSILILLAAFVSAMAQPGAVDTSFKTQIRSGTTTAILVQDEKIWTGGRLLFTNSFDAINTHLASLNLDGSTERLLDSPTGPDDVVVAIAAQADGRILLGGAFNRIGSTSRNGIARLNVDGSLDRSFDPGTGALAATLVYFAGVGRFESGGVSALAIQSDGRILIAGYFTNVNSIARRALARLNPDGTVDTTFHPPADLIPFPRTIFMELTPDQKVVIAETYGEGDETASRPFLCRLNQDGSPDDSFQQTVVTNGSMGVISALTSDPEGNIYLGLGTELVKFLPDGRQDRNFQASASYDLRCALHVMGDKLILGGSYTEYNGHRLYSELLRVDNDGSLDETFALLRGSRIGQLALQPDGKILVGGQDFSQIGGYSRPGLARLHGGYAPPLISESPSAQTRVTGGVAEFSPVVTGTRPIAFTWFHEGRVLPGETNANLVIENLQPEHAGAYAVEARNPAGAVRSSPALLTLISPPVITMPLADRTAFEWETVVFEVSASGTPPLEYRWMKDGVILRNETNAVLRIADVRASSSGTYSVTVSNSGGSATGEASLTVVVAPALLEEPADQIVEVGNDVEFRVNASGSAPLVYQWFSSSGMPVGTGQSLTLTSVATNASGIYWAKVENSAGSTNSRSATLRVIDRGTPLVSINGLPVRRNGQSLNFVVLSNVTEVQVSIESSFPNSTIFYTLDGSEPDFAACLYSGAFQLTNSAVVRARAYSTSFESAEAEPVEISLSLLRSLAVDTPGGGDVLVDPPGGQLPSGTAVTLQAIPWVGWRFLGWEGDVHGTNSPLALTMDRDLRLSARFGTELQTSTVGAGVLLVLPRLAFYPFGTKIRVAAYPQPGNFFALWGSHASGNANPLEARVTNALPMISAMFVPTDQDQVTLGVIPCGNGSILVDPRSNVYNLGQMVTLTAVPSADGEFLNWGGDARGTTDALSLVLDKSKVVFGNFTGSTGSIELKNPTTDAGGSFRAWAAGSSGGVLYLQTSSDLREWSSKRLLVDPGDGVEFLDSIRAESSGLFYRIVR